ncbi:hypothetical protein O6H91_Y487000 [Diphasiastrum complanatum]|nr:hypothetical protein O6H91_Y487000 [Diphasiastrum complanatum]
MKTPHPGGGGHARPFTKFRMPTAENLIPIRLDIELDGQRLKDAFTWDTDDSQSEIMPFARLLVKDLNLPAGFTQQVVQSMQSQVAEFHLLQGQEMSTEEKVQVLKLDLRVNNLLIHDQFLWDVSNFDSDPEGFARTFCKDLDIEDPEVAVSGSFCMPLCHRVAHTNLKGFSFLNKVFSWCCFVILFTTYE